MPQGGTTIKPTAPLQMPNEQKWAREFDNNRQATAAAASLSSLNPNPNKEIEQANINQEQIQDAMNMNLGSIKDTLKQTSEIAGQMIFREALRQSWLNLIDSCGLTFIYINFHFIMAYLARNPYFCKFGAALSFGGKINTVSQVDGGFSEMLTEYAELIVLFLVDGIILFLLLLIVCFISLIVGSQLTLIRIIIETIS